MEIPWLDELMDRVRIRLAAQSCTLYVPDTYWADEYRLVSMPGVRIREPMFGFGFPASSRRIICEGHPEMFLSGLEASTFQGPCDAALAQIEETSRSLFAGFGEREGIGAFSRLFYPGSNDKPAAVLFVNFANPQSFDATQKNAIREILGEIAPRLPEITTELVRLDAKPLAEAMKILHPAKAFVSQAAEVFSFAESGELASQLSEILRVALDALGIPESEGVGTIHLYEPEASILKLIAHRGNAQTLAAARTQSVDRGVGVASWVVLRQRAILISDLETSPYRAIQVPVHRDVRSELAVPMIANGKLVGVLNLESTKKNAFSSASVRSLWYAASSAALAFQITKGNSITRSLLDVCATAATDKEGRESLKKTALVLRDALNADYCDIWHYNQLISKFDAAGSTHEQFEPAISSDGWSMFIQASNKAVWLSEIQSETGFHSKAWNSGVWAEISRQDGCPLLVNKRVVDFGITAQLGIPIAALDGCGGVAWVKYKQGRLPPGPERMREVLSYVNEASLVLDAVRWRLEMPSQFNLRQIGQKLNAWWETGVLNLGPLTPYLEGYIIHRLFHAHVSGDFHVVKEVKKLRSVVGLLIGDATGKAVPGLLNALPFMTGFEVFGEDSGSARYVMDRLMNVAHTLGVSGTGACLTFTLFQEKIEKFIHNSVYLAATSAGHPSFIFLRRKPKLDYHLVPDPNTPAHGPLLGDPLRRPLSEEQLKLEPDDMLIGYSDGVGQALAPGSEDQQDWADRIIQLALGNTTKPCKDIAEAIIAAAEAVGPLEDDMTVCVLRRTTQT